MLNNVIEFLNKEVSGCNATLVSAEVGDTPIIVEPSTLKQVCFALRDSSEFQFTTLEVVSGVDYSDRIEVNYMLCSFKKNYDMILKVKLPKSGDELPKVESVCDVWKSANFLERETYDMVGVDFTGHPDFRRILTDDDWEGFPLRKDYVVAKEYNGMEINPEHKINQADFDFMTKLKIDHANPKIVTGSWSGHVTPELSDALERKLDSLEK